MNEDLVLVPEVLARRALHRQRVRLKLLAPNGAWIGFGMLRVLRLKINDSSDSARDGKDVEVTVGYESYQPVSSAARLRT